MKKKTTRRKTPRRRRVTNRTEETKSANPGRAYELTGLVFVAAGMISLCGLFGLNVGFVGVYFAKCLRYLFGTGAVFVTILILLIGYQYMTRHRGLVYSLRFFGMGMLFLSILAIWHHMVIPVGEEILPDSLPRGGGLFGGGLLFVLRKFFGVDGTLIILCTGVIGAVLLSTTWSLATGLLKTQRTAAKGAKATGEAVSHACEKVASAGTRVEERVAGAVKEKVRHSFYNQERDHHFDEEPSVANRMEDRLCSVSDKMVQNTDNMIHADPLPVTPMDADHETNKMQDEEEQEPIPGFTIEYGRNAEMDHSDDDSLCAAKQHSESSSSPSAQLLKQQRTPLPDYQEIAPMMPAASLLDGSVSNASQDKTAVVRPYQLPGVTDILSKHVKKKNASLEMEIEENARTLQKTLADFKVKATIINACHGPAVTRYELEPAPGVKVSKITNLAEDIALRLAAASVRIEQIPGKSAIGIEVPNKELEGVQLREVLESPKFNSAKSKLTVGLGMDIGGQAIFADLAKMPHLLVAGATGSGKSVCINTLITSILFKARPDEVKFILVDPKMVELSNYNGIPHLMVPVVTDAKKAASVLNWSVREMEKRYAKFAESNVRNMDTYNRKFPEETMPAIVIIIDELADLMMVAPHDVEDAICRLAQKARAAGIHMVLATQRPSVDVITGIIKANIPSRISFAVSSQIDSRTILDRSGAEKLLGKGDMLFYPVGASKPQRVQGAFISDEEVERLLEFIRSQGQEMETNEEIVAFTEQALQEESEAGEGNNPRNKTDELLADAVDLVMSTGQASSSSIQRRFHIGYTRAARLIDTMEELHIVGPNAGSKPRNILMSLEQAHQAISTVQPKN